MKRYLVSAQGKPDVGFWAGDESVTLKVDAVDAFHATSVFQQEAEKAGQDLAEITSLRVLDLDAKAAEEKKREDRELATHKFIQTIGTLIVEKEMLKKEKRAAAASVKNPDDRSMPDLGEGEPPQEPKPAA